MGCLGDDPPDPAKSYVGGINADLETFPERRLIDAAAMLGHKITVDIPGKGPQTFDFTGMGQADFQSKYGDSMLGQLLQIQRDLGPEYVQQRLEELAIADPQGAQMRQKLWDTIRSRVDAGPTDRPDLQLLEDEIAAQLEQAGQLDERTANDISQRVRGGQVARGNYSGNAAVTQEADVMAQAAETQRNLAQQQAMAFLTTGVSPEDAAYREQMQDLSNLGAFIGGETPVAQFGQLTGAANGIVPGTPVAPGMGLDPNAGANGMAWANNVWATKQAGQGVNPWVAGLAGAFQGANAWASMGGKAG